MRTRTELIVANKEARLMLRHVRAAVSDAAKSLTAGAAGPMALLMAIVKDIDGFLEGDQDATA